MPTCNSCHSVNVTPTRRVAMVVAMALLAAAVLVLGQPSGQLPVAVGGSTPATAAVPPMHAA